MKCIAGNYCKRFSVSFSVLAPPQWFQIFRSSLDEIKIAKVSRVSMNRIHCDPVWRCQLTLHWHPLMHGQASGQSEVKHCWSFWFFRIHYYFVRCTVMAMWECSDQEVAKILTVRIWNCLCHNRPPFQRYDCQLGSLSGIVLSWHLAGGGGGFWWHCKVLSRKLWRAGETQMLVSGWNHGIYLSKQTNPNVDNGPCCMVTMQAHWMNHVLLPVFADWRNEDSFDRNVPENQGLWKNYWHSGGVLFFLNVFRHFNLGQDISHALNVFFFNACEFQLKLCLDWTLCHSFTLFMEDSWIRIRPVNP